MAPLRFASPVIPALWEATHERIPEGGMTDTLLIERPTAVDGEWGAATTWTAVYGPALGRVEPDWNKAGLVVVGGRHQRDDRQVEPFLADQSHIAEQASVASQVELLA